MHVMRLAIMTVVAMLLSASASIAEPLNWVKKPQLTFDENAKTWYATFELDALTDVEVALIDPATNSVVRHLAAGVLGPKVPPPFAANSRFQKLEWDGKDDYRTPVPKPATLVVRVRAGMSVELKKSVGGDPYAYFSAEMGQSDHSPWGINGLEVKSDGKVYVLGHSSTLGPPALRQYDIDGNYLRTVFPPPAGKPVKDMMGWGINVQADGTYTPKFNRLTDPSLSTTILDTGTGGLARLFPTPGTDRLSLWSTGFGDVSFEMMTLNADGTIPENPKDHFHGPLVKNPPLALGQVAPESHVVNSMAGPVFTCVAADGKSFYLSGLYAVTSLYGSIKEIKTDGFWRDGQIWKVDLETRTAKPFFSLDKINARRDGSYSALHGVAVDKDGQVFVCDRSNQRVVVLDNDGKIVREIPVLNPDAIALSARTGAMFVTTRIGDEYSGLGHVDLLKFNDWRKDDKPAVSLRVSETSYTGQHMHSYVAIGETEKASNVWVAYTNMPVRIYKDDEKGFALLKDFYNVEGAQRCMGFDRIEADQKTGDVYTLDNHAAVWKVSDWQKPQFVRVPLGTASIAIDARHRHIYANTGGGHSKTGLARYHLDQDKYPPANIGTSGTNQLTTRIYYEWCFTGNGDMGFAVAPNGNLAALDQHGNLLFFQGDQAKLPWEPTALAQTGILAGGVRFDLAGNLYVGYVDKKPTIVLPGFEGDEFSGNIGRVHKYSPTGSLESGNLFPTNPAGPSKTYDVPYGAFDTDCIVRTPRFSVDGFGRICYPTNISQRVSLMDNAGNEILHFGTYGNRDSMGGLPGDLVPTKGIPLGFPNSVDMTDNYIYVGDMVNHRLLQIQKNFRLDTSSTLP